MKAKKYAKAIELIVGKMYQVDKMEHNQEWYESVRNIRAAKQCAEEACSLIEEAIGMKKMLSLLSGKDYDTISYDVLVELRSR